MFVLVELQFDDFGRVDLVSAKLASGLVPELVVVVEEYEEFVHEHFNYLVVVWLEEPVEDLVVQLFLLLAVVHHHSREPCPRNATKSTSKPRDNNPVCFLSIMESRSVGFCVSGRDVVVGVCATARSWMDSFENAKSSSYVNPCK